MSNSISVKERPTILFSLVEALSRQVTPRIALSRELLESTILPLAMSVIVSLALSYCIKCFFLAGGGAGETPARTLLYTAPMSLVAFLLAVKTHSFIRIAALFQLAAVALLSLNGFGAAQPALFADVFSGILCGGISGTFNANLKAQQRRLRAQSSEITLRRKQLLDAKLALVKHDEVERRLLAADLHDQVLHDLKMVKQTLSACRSHVEPAMLESLEADVAHATSAVREVMDQLFPSSLEHLGLIGAIEECLDNAGRRCGFESFVRARIAAEEFETLSRVETLLLFRLIQEAVNNISKHAKAGKVACQLIKDNGELVVKIIDDGVGLKEGNGDGRGLKYMKQRAELIGASIAWLPNPDTSGTVVEIRIARAGKPD